MTRSTMARKILALLVLWCFVYSGTPEKSVNTCCLGVPPIAQQANFLCWAACTEMIMEYFHRRIDSAAPVMNQLSLARFWYINNIRSSPVFWHDSAKLLKDTNYVADGRSIPTVFNQTGTPFDIPGKSPCPFYRISPITTITWDTLCLLMAQHCPVTFAMYAQGFLPQDSGFAHFLVAEGAVTTKTAPLYRWVSVNDPWPIGINRPHARHYKTAYTDLVHPASIVAWDTNAYWYSLGATYCVSIASVNSNTHH